MKKLLFLILVVIGFTACNEPTVKKADLPIEVVTLKEQVQFDTLLVIPTNDYVYVFKPYTKEYVGRYDTKDGSKESFLVGIVIGIGIMLLIVLVALKNIV